MVYYIFVFFFPPSVLFYDMFLLQQSSNKKLMSFWNCYIFINSLVFCISANQQSRNTARTKVTGSLARLLIDFWLHRSDCFKQ